MTTALSIEDLRFTPPSMSESDVLTHVHASHGLRGELRALSGERDQNFRLIDGEGGQWLLKLRPPLVFEPQHAELALAVIEESLQVTPDE